MQLRFLGLVVLVSALATVVSAQTKPAANSAAITRGKYLVNEIGKCGDCHTPTDKMGRPIGSRTLQGATLLFKPMVNIPQWAPVAPDIAGLSWTSEQIVTFLTTGKRPNGSEAAPPMPAYRMKKADATAIAAYLKSLKSF